MTTISAQQRWACGRVGDIGFCTADWSIAGKAPDGKDVKAGGTSVEVVKKTPGGNWVYVIDSPYGTA